MLPTPYRPSPPPLPPPTAALARKSSISGTPHFMENDARPGGLHPPTGGVGSSNLADAHLAAINNSALSCRLSPIASPLVRGISITGDSLGSVSTDERDTQELELIRTNSRFRKYSSGIQRFVSSFESIVEWPDIITFLSKLTKYIQMHADFQAVPLRLSVARRLSQALNPSLPAGVHQKALESYAVIFDVIGQQNLARDAMIWTVGLFPYFAHAQMSIKPTLLQTISRFFLPMQKAMHPFLKHLIIALLPGLDEEDNEYFEPHLTLLEQVHAAVDSTVYFQDLMSVIALCPSLRKAGLFLIQRRFLNLIEASPLTAHFLSACFGDSVVLVKRLALDVLLARFPPTKAECFANKDWEILLTSAIRILLCREMSLNRRLYSWLIGPTEEYYEKFSRVHVSRCLLSSVQSPSPVENIRAYKILINFLDKKVIATCTLEDLMRSQILSLFENTEKRPLMDDSEALDLLANANMFLRMLAPYQIWVVVNRLLREGHEKGLAIVRFAYEKIKNNEDDYLKIHLPITVMNLVLLLSPEESKYCLDEVVSTIAFIFPGVVFHSSEKSPTLSGRNHDSGEDDDIENDNEDAIMMLDSYLAGSFSFQGVSVSVVGLLMQKHAICLARKSMTLNLSKCLSFLAHKLHFAPPEDTLAEMLKISTAQPAQGAANCETACRLALLTYICEFPAIIPASKSERILMSLLEILSTRSQTVNYLNLSSILWKVVSLDSAKLSKIFIAYFTRNLDSVEGFEVFGLFWKNCRDQDQMCYTLSRPLLGIADSLGDRDLRPIAENWIHSYLVSYKHFLNPVLALLMESRVTRRTVNTGQKIEYFTYDGEIDFSLLSYGFALLNRIFETAKSELSCVLESWSILHEMSYGEAILAVSMQYLRTFWDDGTNVEIQQSACTLIINLAVLHRFQSAAVVENLGVHVLEILYVCIEKGILVLQDHALALLHVLGQIEAGPCTSGLSKIQSRGRLIEFTSNFSLLSVYGENYSNSNSSNATNQNQNQNQQPQSKTISAHSSGGCVDDSGTLENRIYTHPLFEVVILQALNVESNMPILPSYVRLLQTKMRNMCRILEKLSTTLFQRLKTTLEESFHENRFVLYLRALKMIYDFAYSKEYASREKAISTPPTSRSLNLIQSDQSALSKYKPLLPVEETASVNVLLTNTESNTLLEQELYSPSTDSLRMHLSSLLPEIATQMVKIRPKVGEFQADSFTETPEVQFALNCSGLLETFSKFVARVCPSQWIDSLVLVWHQSRISIGEIIKISSFTDGEIFKATLQNLSARTSPRKAHEAGYLLDNLSVEDVFAFLLEFQLERWDHVAETHGCFGNFIFNFNAEAGVYSTELMALTTVYTSSVCKMFRIDQDARRQGATIFRKQFMQIVDFVSQQWLRKEKDIFTYIPLKRMATRPKNRDREISSEKSRNAHRAMRELCSRAMLVVETVIADSEQLSSMLAEILAVLVFPVLKQEGISEFYMDVLELLSSISQYTGYAKLWKKEAWDYFLAPQFFPVPPGDAISYWKVLLRCYSRDMHLIAELICKLGVPQSSALFGSRDQENAATCQVVRQLALVLWSNPDDEFAPLLPQIREKLNMLLQNHTAEVTSDLFLLLRVCMLRFNHAPLGDLWTYVMMDAIRLLRVFPSRERVYSREALSSLLAICKFLDFVCCTRQPEFQIYERIFADHQRPGVGMLWDIFNGYETEVQQCVQNHESAPSYTLPLLRMHRISEPTELLEFVKHCTYSIFTDPVYVSTRGIDEWIETDLIQPIYRRQS